MDEGTLNDLLECSVCLERLDTSSKVLPCQHTFCKKCLEEIVVTKKELRCPECRVLVETSIDDLPPNVLLMRILEGMRNAAPKRRSTGAPSIHHQRSYSQPVGGTIFPSTTLAAAVPAAVTQHVPPDGVLRPHSHIKQIPLMCQPVARAVYDYVSKEPGDLSFKKGDIITLKKQVDLNWYHGEIGGVHGVFPLCYVQIMQAPSNIPQCRAMFDFKMANDEEEGCLTFKKGEIITVIRRIDENWAEGRLGDRVGIFPIAFVEMNGVARAFMKLSSNFQPGPSRLAPPTPTSEETTPLIPTDHSQAAVTSQHQQLHQMHQLHQHQQHQLQLQQQQPLQQQQQQPQLQQQPQPQLQQQPQLQPQQQPQSQQPPQPQSQQSHQPPQSQSQQPQQPQQPQHQPQQQQQQQSSLSATQVQPQAAHQTPHSQSQNPSLSQPVQQSPQSQPQPLLQTQPVAVSSVPKPPTSVAASFIIDSNSSTSSSSTTPNTSSTSSSSSSSTTPSSPASPPPRPSAWSPQTRQSRSSAGTTGSHENGQYNQQKRHSLTALLAAPAQQSSSNRHSAEVLGSADLSESNTEPPLNGEFVRQGSGRHHRRSGSSELPLSSVGSIPPPLPQGIHHSLVNNSNLPATYIALYPYKPQKADELELRKGGVYTVTERCQDGWFKGTSNRTLKSGVFPGNYVAFVKSVPGAQQQLRSVPRGGVNANTPTRSASSGAVSPASAAASSSSTSPSPVSYTRERKPNSSSPQTSSLRQQQTGSSDPPSLPPRSVSPAQSSTTVGAVSWHSHPSSLTATEATRTTPSTSPQAPPTQGAQSSLQSSQSSVSPSSTSAVPSTTPLGTPLKTCSEKVKEKKERGSVSLMRRLTNMKKSKSPPPPYSMDNPVFEDGSVLGTPTHSVHPAHPIHVRSGSCPSQLLQLPQPESLSQQSQPLHHRTVATTAASGAGGSQRLRHKERPNVVVTNFALSGRSGDGAAASASSSSQTPGTHHRKSNSLDAGTSQSTSSNGQNPHSSPHGSSHGESSRKSKQLVQPARERFRCVVAYPPHSEYELELRVGDVIYVHRKREDGWYKGTQQRTGRTGLFPASFVEAF